MCVCERRHGASRVIIGATRRWMRAVICSKARGFLCQNGKLKLSSEKSALSREKELEKASLSRVKELEKAALSRENETLAVRDT